MLLSRTRGRAWSGLRHILRGLATQEGHVEVLGREEEVLPLPKIVEEGKKPRRRLREPMLLSQAIQEVKVRDTRSSADDDRW